MKDDVNFNWVSNEHKIKSKGKLNYKLKFKNGFIIEDIFHIIEGCNITIVGISTMHKYQLVLDIAKKAVIFPEKLQKSIDNKK